MAALVAVSCTKTEKLTIQKINTVDPNNITDSEYYQNLRAWKESDHIKTFVYFAAYAPPEGATSMYITYSESSKRLLSMPDSLDMVNLWMGVPGNNPNDVKNYSPNAWADMQYCRKQKGTKFVMHADASKDHLVDLETGDVYWATDPDAPAGSVSVFSSDEAMNLYAQMILNTIYDNEIDGVDIDYEGWSSGALDKLVRILSESIGPLGEDTSKLLIVDFFGGSPSAGIEPCLDYCVKQAYSQQGAGSTTPASGYPQSKMIYCEQYNQSSSEGVNYKHGGYPKGNYTYPDGTTRKMYSLESFSRDCVSKGGGGFGAYYIDNDFFNTTETLRAHGINDANTTYNSYAFLRYAISIANPVGEYEAE